MSWGVGGGCVWVFCTMHFMKHWHWLCVVIHVFSVCNCGYSRLVSLHIFCILHAIVNAPWYVTKDMFHRDLGIPAIHDVIHNRSTKHRTKLETHPNRLLQPRPRNITLRLKRLWLADL
jgi:hypothetical protein